MEEAVAGLQWQEFDVPELKASRAFFQIPSRSPVSDQPISYSTIIARLLSCIDDDAQALFHSHVAEVSNNELCV